MNNQSIQHKKDSLPISFTQFKQYCEKIVPSLNCPQVVERQNSLVEKTIKGKEIISYKAAYRIASKKFAKEHDCEYLEIEQVSRVVLSRNDSQRRVLLKINITYSIAYQVPLLLFMPYYIHIEQTQQNESHLNQRKEKEIESETIEGELKPLTKQEIPSILNADIGSSKLLPSQQQTGVFVIQNPINKEYFYSLHHCMIGSQGMEMKELIPYYLALLGCHPELMV